MNEFTYKQTDGGRTSDGFTHESKDCTVRAIAVACNVPYAVAHAEMARRGRRPGQGVMFLREVQSNPVFCGKLLVPVFDMNENGGKCICLCTAQKMFPKGRYVIRKAHHAFALVDGVQHDKGANSKWIMVKQMWRVDDVNVA